MEKAHIDYRMQDSEGTIALKGHVVIESAETLHKTLQGAFAEAEKITVDMGGTDEIDITCVQLFCSAHKTALETGKTFAVINIPGEVRTIIDAMNLHKGGTFTNVLSEACMWYTQEAECETTIDQS